LALRLLVQNINNKGLNYYYYYYYLLHDTGARGSVVG
jgi:hypothetical protein